MGLTQMGYLGQHRQLVPTFSMLYDSNYQLSVVCTVQGVMKSNCTNLRYATVEKVFLHANILAQDDL